MQNSIGIMNSCQLADYEAWETPLPVRKQATLARW